MANAHRNPLEVELLSQIQLPLDRFEREIQRLNSENEALKEENVLLKKQNNDRTQKCGDLENKVTAMMREAGQHPATAMVDSFKKQPAPMSVVTAKTDLQSLGSGETTAVEKTQFEEMKERLRYQEPLVKCAIKIRRRFYEHCKEHLGFGKSNDVVIAEGDAAAHHGDILTDNAMLVLLRMKAPLIGETDNNDYEEEDIKKIYRALYDRKFQGYISAISKLVAEMRDMSATLSSFSVYRSKHSESQDFDLEKFAVLQRQMDRQGTALRNQNLSLIPCEWFSVLDECPHLNRTVAEMREVIERCVQRRGILKRQAKKLALEGGAS